MNIFVLYSYGENGAGSLDSAEVVQIADGGEGLALIDDLVEGRAAAVRRRGRRVGRLGRLTLDQGEALATASHCWIFSEDDHDITFDAQVSAILIPESRLDEAYELLGADPAGLLDLGVDVTDRLGIIWDDPA